MKLRTFEELNRFNALLDNCLGRVWIQSENGELYILTNPECRLAGLAKLSGDEAEGFAIYARRREDEMLLLSFICELNEKTA